MYAFRRIASAVICILGLGIVSGCNTPPPPQYPELTFAHMPVITLGVSRIEIVDNFKPMSDAKHIESLMPTSPETALRNWARDRLRANGVSGVAKFIIEDAAVTETNLARTTGLKGVFTNDQAQRYDARVKVSVRLEGVPRVSEAYAEAEAMHAQTVAENATVNVREQAWFNLTEAVMKDFDPAMATSIRKHLADFVR